MVPSTLTIDPAGPLSSAELPVASAERAAEVEEKHRRVAEFLSSRGLDALLLQRPANFAWFTGGADCTRGNLAAPAAALFVTPQARVVVCGNADTNLLFERELPALGFQLKERPWHEPRQVLIDDLCRGRKVASDTGVCGSLDVSGELVGLRFPLTERECQQLRTLGRIVVHALEATARSLEPGRSQADVAGELAHRLIRHMVRPERIQVLADGIGRRYRHWNYDDTSIDQWCVLSVVGRRCGLCLGAARTVCFGRPPAQVEDFFRRAVLVHATGLFFSKVDWQLADTWARVARIYEKYGAAEEWRLSDQGDVIAYELSEVPVTPGSSFRLTHRMPLFWHPSVGPCLVGDTVLVGSSRTKQERGSEILTPPVNWPTVSVEVKGVALRCPGMLVR